MDTLSIEMGQGNADLLDVALDALSRRCETGNETGASSYLRCGFRSSPQVQAALKQQEALRTNDADGWEGKR